MTTWPNRLVLGDATRDNHSLIISAYETLITTTVFRYERAGNETQVLPALFCRYADKQRTCKTSRAPTRIGSVQAHCFTLSSHHTKNKPECVS